MGLRMPEEFLDFVEARVASGDARTVTDYLLALVRKDATRHGVTL